MKKLWFLLITCTGFSLYAQPPIETMGQPSTQTAVSSYTGWTNQGIVNYTGDAIVDNSNPSSYNIFFGSGGGNALFTNTPGTYFQISNLPALLPGYGAVNIEFGMYGYDLSNLGELQLTASIDSGATWFAVPYRRYLGDLFPPSAWDYFVGGFEFTTQISKLMVKFTQSSSTKIFRVDDIRFVFAYLLPIQLNYFTAVANDNIATIEWRAVTTAAHESFEVEKSLNGEVFSLYKRIVAKGPGAFDYDIDDTIKGKTFYRLKMISADGKHSYSRIVPVTPSIKFTQLIYPIPAKDAITIRLNNIPSQTVSFSIIDATGRLCLKKTFKTNAGTMMLYKLDLKTLEAGIYYLTTSTPDSRYTTQITVIK